MLIAGAGGHAKEVLDIVISENQFDEINFFDDVTLCPDKLIFEKFTIIKSLDQVEDYFKTTKSNFILGIGNPLLRYKLSIKLQSKNGVLTSIISKNSIISKFNVSIGVGVNIMNHIMISNDVIIGEGALINAFVSVHHGVEIGKYTELAPHSVVLGNAIIGDFSLIGSNATILPNVKVGSNVKIGAGSVVINDLPDNCTAVGVPAKIINI